MCFVYGNDVNDVGFAFDFLTYIADSSAGAEGVVAANALPYLLERLESLSPDVRRVAGRLTGMLARYQSTAAPLIAINPWNQLVALSRQGRNSAPDALTIIAHWPDGAEATLAAHVLDHVPQWFTSQGHSMRDSACRFLVNLAQHKSTAGAVMDLETSAQLVTILELDTYDYFWDPLECHALEALGSFINMPNARQSTCDLLAAIAEHESTVQAVAPAVPLTLLTAARSGTCTRMFAKAQTKHDYLASALQVSPAGSWADYDLNIHHATP
ncbi:hypothetical protein FB451DRAFT_1388175 [Mycena latifolia]|nr:hypothetical protein FB451DRAFT_1388175 [Mycena latifolia]